MTLGPRRAQDFILSIANADELNSFCKTKNVSEIKREQLLTLAILVHVKQVL